MQFFCVCSKCFALKYKSILNYSFWLSVSTCFIFGFLFLHVSFLPLPFWDQNFVDEVKKIEAKPMQNSEDKIDEVNIRNKANFCIIN